MEAAAAKVSAELATDDEPDEEMLIDDDEEEEDRRRFLFTGVARISSPESSPFLSSVSMPVTVSSSTVSTLGTSCIFSPSEGSAFCISSSSSLSVCVAMFCLVADTVCTKRVV